MSLTTRLTARGLFLLASIIGASIGLTAVASPAHAASLHVDPASASPGETVTISGEGFLPLVPVAVCWDEPGCSNLGRFTPQSSSFQGSVTVPKDATAGSHTIHACQTALDSSLTCASTALTVVVPTTTTTTVPPSTTTTAATTTTTTQQTTTSTTSAPTTAPPAVSTTRPPSSGTTTPTSSVSVGQATTTVPAPTTPTTTADSTTTSMEDQVIGGAWRYIPPNSGGSGMGSDEPGSSPEATGLDGSRDDGTGVGDWLFGVIAVGLVGVGLWVADRLTRGQRRRQALQARYH